ncbi:hypothetical protein [Streptomyces sp. NBC_00829]|uniref:hypothetical protein n=1 Tax=Streptomyces sp. NBC_00829 TaxID=2903679 RepID=UPI0038697FCC|nr:hypothetical protein OG293_10405 [Streptomyces sp. NBC_00829]
MVKVTWSPRIRTEARKSRWPASFPREELGLPEQEARQRGLLAYSSYLGHTQLSHAAPDALPGTTERPAYLESVMDTLLSGLGPSAPPGD